MKLSQHVDQNKVTVINYSWGWAGREMDGP